MVVGKLEDAVEPHGQLNDNIMYVDPNKPNERRTPFHEYLQLLTVRACNTLNKKEALDKQLAEEMILFVMDQIVAGCNV